VKILGIETATNLCAAAIVENGTVHAEHSSDSPHVHSEKLISIIDQCFNDAKLTLNSIDGIAVSIGPGSFTGLRIGLSVAKGLSYASGKPLAAVPTLKGLAMHGIAQNSIQNIEFILPLLDARRDEVYIALYRLAGIDLHEVIPSSAMSLAHLVNQLPVNKKILILGDGTEKFEHFIKKADNYAPNSYIILQNSSNYCSAAIIAQMGSEIINAQGGADIASLEPFYVKDFYTLVRTQHHKEIK
jgi:tRNA threonylcarbamoyladenosine biosynthesis protein TsaB